MTKSCVCRIAFVGLAIAANVSLCQDRELDRVALANRELLEPEMRGESRLYFVGEDVCLNLALRNPADRSLTVYKPFTERGVWGINVLERHSKLALERGLEYDLTTPSAMRSFAPERGKQQIAAGEVIRRRVCSSDSSWDDPAFVFPRRAGTYRLTWAWGMKQPAVNLELVMPKRTVLLRQMVVSHKLIQPPPRRTDDHVGEPDPYETLYTTLLAIEEQDGTVWLGYIVPSIVSNGMPDGMAPRTLNAHQVFRRVEKIAAVPSKVEANVVGKDLDVYYTIGSRVEKRTLKDLLR